MFARNNPRLRMYLYNNHIIILIIILKERKICSTNYQDFINSINELLEVRQDTRQLREAVITINNDSKDSAEYLLDKV